MADPTPTPNPDPSEAPAASPSAVADPPSASAVPSKGRVMWGLLWRTAAVLLLLALLTGVVLNQVARYQRLALLERFDELGIGALDDRGVPADEAEDGTAFLEAAIKLSGAVTPYAEDLPSTGLNYVLEPRERLPEPMVEALRQTRDLREQLGRLIDQAGRRKMPSPEWSANPLLNDRYYWRYSGSRRVARRLEHSAVLAMQENEPWVVADTVRRFDIICGALDGGLLIHHLIDLSIRSLGVGVVQDALSCGELPAEELDAIRDIYLDWNRDIDVDGAFRQELRFVRSTIADPLIQTTAHNLSRYNFAGIEGIEVGEISVPGVPAGPGPVAFRTGMGFAVLFPDLDFWGWTLEARAALDGYESFGKLSGDREALLAWVNTTKDDAEWGEISPQYRASVRTAVFAADDYAVAAAAMAVEVHRLKHGDWPGSLAQAHGDEAPVDWLGRPLGYRVVDGDAWVYALGANGRDDGGMSDWYFDDAPEDADDYRLFRLYAMDKRNTLPPPKKIEADESLWPGVSFPDGSGEE